MVPSGHKTLVHYPDGTSKVITLYVRPLEGRIIAHGWEVTNVAPGENVGLESRSSTRSRSHARRTSFRTFRVHRDPQSWGRLAQRRQWVREPLPTAC